MAQCKAQTNNGAQCTRPAAPPSRTLCKQHQNVLATGSTVYSAETRRRFPRSRPATAIVEAGVSLGSPELSPPAAPRAPFD